MIGLVRQKYPILWSIIPIHYVTKKPGEDIPLLDHIVRVCCALSNVTQLCHLNNVVAICVYIVSMCTSINYRTIKIRVIIGIIDCHDYYSCIDTIIRQEATLCMIMKYVR